MGKESLDGEQASKDGCENEYDEWLRYLMLERKVPGYVGTTIIYTRRYRFSHKAYNSQI
jgi:antibiotic biosynthesis monooxygenase (ABM) superfamily enzyme